MRWYVGCVWRLKSPFPRRVVTKQKRARSDEKAVSEARESEEGAVGLERREERQEEEEKEQERGRGRVSPCRATTDESSTYHIKYTVL